MRCNMEFPDFQEFLETLDEKRMEEILGDMRETKYYEIHDIRDARNWNAYISDLMHETISFSIGANLRVLRAYHEWIQKQIEQ